ncbi:probable serine/threonine-protein kinase PIX13 isoform X2 [Trifolium pratense]|uniref:probable serine/threonine-protein kinase PIX13 isoform X2 n=1 Tax=Trifolium pratense TaxID=57577 RepID=UPI001E694DF4|nr:probable serine/threonine-protein kinase PIX13 isoform X2 [Trifolium pratense]
MGNCWTRSLQSSGDRSNSNTAPDTNNQSGSILFSARLSNLRLIRNSNSTSLGRSSNSGGNSRLFSSSNNHSTGNNTSTSFWDSENSQASRVRDEEEFPNGHILDAANLKVFTWAELKSATRNFRPENVLGEGGFGKVFKGLIKEGAESKKGGGLTIAIKILNSHSRQGLAEWQSEVNFLGRLSHPNLVKLLGFGHEDRKLFLVYEFQPRGSLDNHLFGRGSNVRPLSWDKRLKVIIGAARGLNFLHSEKIIYRDFKPSNILLDKVYTAKLSDFGMARSGPSDDHSHVSTQVVGTSGYAAPEYVVTGHLYVKSDVYGFGLVLMEILTGKQIGEIMRIGEQTSLCDWLKSNLLNRAKSRSNMDPKLEGKYPPNLASQIAQLALKCIQTEHKIRPSMKEVVETLESIEAANDKPADNRKRTSNSREVQQHGQLDGS